MRTLSFLKICLAGLLSCLLLGSCTRGISPATYLIPKDALFATRANVLRATYQVPDWREIFKEELQVNLTADSVNGPGTFLGSGKAFVFGDLLKKEKNYVAFAVAVRSKKALERFLHRISTDFETFRYKNFKYTVRNRNVLAWSNNILLIINNRQALNDEELKNQFFRIVNQKKSEALYSQNANFRLAMKNDYDFSVWVNFEGIKSAGFLQEYVKNIDLKGNYLHLLANFDEGKISAKTEYFTSPEFYKSYQNLLSGTIRPEILKNAPVPKPVIMTAVSVNPQGIGKLLKDIEWTEKANNMAKSITLNLDQVIEMMRGDIVLIVNKNKKAQMPLDSNAIDPPKPNDLVVGFGLKNMAVYDTLQAVLKRTNMLEDKKDYQLFFEEIYVMKKDSIVYFSKNELVKNDFVEGHTLENPNLLKFNDNSWFMLHAEQEVSADNFKGKKNLLKEVARSLLKKENLKLEEATIHLSNIKDDKDMGGETVVLLKDKTANSLLTMLEVLKEIIYQTKMRIDPNYQIKDN
jgi:hypothetical protein